MELLRKYTGVSMGSSQMGKNGGISACQQARLSAETNWRIFKKFGILGQH